jgi:Tol biopolymer transport system component
MDLLRGVPSRFTDDPFVDNYPVWSPDGSRIVFGSNRAAGVIELHQKPSSGAESESLLLSSSQTKNPNDWSPDGRFLLYRSLDLKMGFDLWALPMKGDAKKEGEQKPFAVVRTNYVERDGQFSPDGKWIAYQSDRSGQFEVYVQPFPGPGGASRVSTNGGAQVRWRRDGKELFYIALDGRLMAVPIQLYSERQAVEISAPVPLFTTNVGGAVLATNQQQYMVSPDGQRFLMNTLSGEAATPITVILNWTPKP